MIELGKIIQEKRIADSLTIEDITKKLNVRKQYITAIENGDINSFASEAYYYGYLKQYMNLLQIENNNIGKNKTNHELIINKPLSDSFKPNALFILIITIVSIIFYNICSSLINSNAIDPIALELNSHTSKLVQIKDDKS